MPKPYDSTLRHLIELEPAAWLELMGIPVPDPEQVQVIDSNLSIVSAEADKPVQVDGPEPFIVHSEFLSGRAMLIPRRFTGRMRWRASGGSCRSSPSWSCSAPPRTAPS